MNLEKIHLILFLKPCYKWNAFNTLNEYQLLKNDYKF